LAARVLNRLRPVSGSTVTDTVISGAFCSAKAHLGLLQRWSQ
jgi:hypothetical protein